jgi:kinesin family protein 18/19
MDMIVQGNEYRTVSPTEANATSSRSHAVLQINVSQKDRNADMHEPHTMATLSIIDLAGSERASATKNRGDRLIEGANINKSLLALGSCINSLCDQRRNNHVPYRNSKLTRLLKFSLGGNCKTVMIVCVSPSSAHFDETQNTLRYANRAKNIQTKVTRNVYNVNRHVKDFLKKIDEQMALINELKQQQKEYEVVAFAKFRKQNDKKEDIAREGIARIRNAYDHAAPERQERTNMMKKLRQIERRISLISTWIAGFDTVCEAREDEEPPRNLSAMRKTAQGILAELEGSRQHYHQRISKNNWERAMDGALQTGLRQLREMDGASEGSEITTLIREAELLRSMADRETHTSILEQERGGDAALIQVLLQAQFDTVAILGQILRMSEGEAVQAAKTMLGKIIASCSTACSQVIKPDGGLPATEAFPPTRSGTPKHRKPVNLLGPSPLPVLPRPSFVDAPPTRSLMNSSPMKGSPRRRKLGPAKKGVVLTPKKKSPVKAAKRGVRWKDDTDDGKLAEFQATPKAAFSTPEFSSAEAPSPPKPSILEEEGSSPLPAPPVASLDLKPKPSRFQAGFLSKRADGSPSLAGPTSYALSFSSDSDQSPLRELEPNKVPHLSSLNIVSTASSDNTPSDSTSNTSSDDDQKPHRTKEAPWSIDRSEAKQIRSALKRNSVAGSGNGAVRTQRRRSPTASGSPPNENGMFSAGHARRMVNGEHQWRGSVLSPRTTPIVKGSSMRRTTMGEDPRGAPGSALRAGPVRMSTIPATAAAGTVGGAAASRGSLANSKSAWR